MPAQAALGARLASGGSAEIFAWGDEQVIKLFRDGVGPQVALNELERTRAARLAGAPAPAVFDTVEWNGRFGIVCERVRGTSMLDELLRGALDATACGRMLARWQLHLHRLSAPSLPAQSERLAQDIAVAPIGEPARSVARERLARLSTDTRLCHGDFHPGNIVLSADGPVFVDWYDATRGAPLADAAQTSLLLLHAEPGLMPGAEAADRLQLVRAQMHTAYLAEYVSNIGGNRRQFDDWRFVVAAARASRSRSATEREALQAILHSELTTR